MTNFKVGDTVKVTNNGRTYTTYQTWADIKGLTKFISEEGSSPKDGSEGIVVAVAEHENSTATLLGIDINGREFILDTQGVTLVRAAPTYAFNIGDKVVAISTDGSIGINVGSVYTVKGFDDEPAVKDTEPILILEEVGARMFISRFKLYKSGQPAFTVGDVTFNVGDTVEAVRRIENHAEYGMGSSGKWINCFTGEMESSLGRVATIENLSKYGARLLFKNADGDVDQHASSYQWPLTALEKMLPKVTERAPIVHNGYDAYGSPTHVARDDLVANMKVETSDGHIGLVMEYNGELIVKYLNKGWNWDYPMFKDDNPSIHDNNIIRVYDIGPIHDLLNTVMNGKLVWVRKDVYEAVEAKAIERDFLETAIINAKVALSDAETALAEFDGKL